MQLLWGQKEKQAQFNKTQQQASRESINVGWCPQGNLEAKLYQLEDLLQIVIFEQQSKMYKSRNTNEWWQEPWLVPWNHKYAVVDLYFLWCGQEVPMIQFLFFLPPASQKRSKTKQY